MNQTDLLEAVSGAVRNREPTPAMTEPLTLESAYQFQHQLTRNLSANGVTDGIKAGVTTSQSQQGLGIHHALLGSLYGNSQIDHSEPIEYLKGRLLESELAVMVDASGRPKAIAPAIEIVSIRFSRPEDFSAVNLVACNLAADAYLLGDWLPWPETRPRLNMNLTRDGDTVNQTNLIETLGTPSEAVHWIWQEAGRREFKRQDETLLLTGACGAVIPAERGRYVADYGSLGTLTFSIE